MSWHTQSGVPSAACTCADGCMVMRELSAYQAQGRFDISIDLCLSTTDKQFWCASIDDCICSPTSMVTDPLHAGQSEA